MKACCFLRMDKTYVGKSEQILSKVVMKVLGVARKRRRERYNCCSEKTRSQLYVSTVLGQGQVQWLQSKKPRLVLRGAFCTDQKALPKIAGLDIVVKLCDDRGLNNSIPDEGPKKKTIKKKKKSVFKNAVEKSDRSRKATTDGLGVWRGSRCEDKWVRSLRN